MTTYRLLWFDNNERLKKSQHIDCQTDHAAINLAGRRVKDYARLEIWDGKRPVCIGGPPVMGSVRQAHM